MYHGGFFPLFTASLPLTSDVNSNLADTWCQPPTSHVSLTLLIPAGPYFLPAAPRAMAASLCPGYACTPGQSGGNWDPPKPRLWGMNGLHRAGFTWSLWGIDFPEATTAGMFSPGICCTLSSKDSAQSLLYPIYKANLVVPDLDWASLQARDRSLTSHHRPQWGRYRQSGRYGCDLMRTAA